MAGQKREVVEGVAGAIAARRVLLGMDVAALVEATGITRQGLAPLLRGERRAYQERLTLPVCRALRWTPDSIARLMRGEPPVLLASPADDQLAALRAQMEQHQQLLVEQAAQLVELTARVGDLGAAVEQLRDQGPQAEDGSP